jgi:hypothetical protein
MATYSCTLCTSFQSSPGLAAECDPDRSLVADFGQWKVGVSILTRPRGRVRPGGAGRRGGQSSNVSILTRPRGRVRRSQRGLELLIHRRVSILTRPRGRVRRRVRRGSGWTAGGCRTGSRPRGRVRRRVRRWGPVPDPQPLHLPGLAAECDAECDSTAAFSSLPAWASPGLAAECDAECDRSRSAVDTSRLASPASRPSATASATVANYASAQAEPGS